MPQQAITLDAPPTAPRQCLLAHGIPVTPQRLCILDTLHRLRRHLTADQLHAHIQAHGGGVARATVFNTLNLFAQTGLVRALVVDPERTYYDIVTTPHAHSYNQDTGELRDIPPEQVRVSLTLPLPADEQLEDISVVVRVRQAPGN